MRPTRRGLAITDLFAIAAVLILVAALGVPTLERARELSKRMVCAVNLKTLGGAAEVYADANKGQWMTPQFKSSEIDKDGIDYVADGPHSTSQPGHVGFQRSGVGYVIDNPLDPLWAFTAVTTTRAYWMLVRSGAIDVKQFICPSNETDFPDPTLLFDPYYDFEEYRNISYGYLVPFGPVEVRPRQGRDHRMIFAADKGPFYLQYHRPSFDQAGPTGDRLRLTDPPEYWRPFNSPNHGGLGTGEGQNALFADGRVEFHRIPAIGVDSDNIYTLMIDQWGFLPDNRIYGETPHESAAVNPYPGRRAFGYSSNSFSTTDSLIYP